MFNLEFEEEARKDLSEYQSLTQQLQMILMQKQQTQLQISELERAEKELETSENSQMYRIIGSIMVPKSKDQLNLEINEEKDSLKLRIDLFSKQEERIKSKLSEITARLSKLENSMQSSQGKSVSGSENQKRQLS